MAQSKCQMKLGLSSRAHWPLLVTGRLSSAISYLFSISALPQFSPNVKTDLIPVQSGFRFGSAIDDSGWLAELEIITSFLEEPPPFFLCVAQNPGLVFFSTSLRLSFLRTSSYHYSYSKTPVHPSLSNHESFL